jgi:hypothetical protein
VTDFITTGLTGGEPLGSLDCNGNAPIASTTSRPFVTLPTSAYSAGRPAFPSITKNWLPDAPEGSLPPFAIATTPCVYWRLFGGASTTL